MRKISVILIRPLYQGNVGAIARAMANFDLSELIIVGSFSIEDEARNRAKHANTILNNIKFVKSFNDLRSEFNILIGTTGIIGTDYNIPRSPVTLSEATDMCKDLEGHIGLVFGPEDTGLSNDELLSCDFTLHIPTSNKYSVLNLSHAASIVFYEFFKIKNETHQKEIHQDETQNNQIRSRHKLASIRERDEAIKVVDFIIDDMNFRSDSDKDTQRVVWRRIIGKSFVTKRELFSVIGFFKNVLYTIKKDEKAKKIKVEKKSPNDHNTK